MIKAVIFDMDGVIAETEHAHDKADKAALLKYGVTLSDEELHRYTGTTAKFMFRELLEKYGLNTTVEKIFREKEKILFELLEEDTQPTKGVIELLRKLEEIGIRLAIASSAHMRLIEYVLQRLEINHLFDTIVGAEDVEHSKPNPEIFLIAAKRLNVSPDECLVVEDAKVGVEAAKSAGMKCLGYINPSSGNQDLSEADFVTDDFSKVSIQQILS